MPELEVLPTACDFGIGIITYTPLTGSLLTGKLQSSVGSCMRQLEAKYGIKLGPENTQFADFSALCEDIGEHVVATALTLQHPAIASAIVGVHNVEQLDGLEEAARLHLNPEAMQYLDETFSINRSRKLRPGAAPEAYAW